MLADGGIPLGNQSVILKNINDSPIIMKKLVQDLVRIRVRPYYIYQCDLSKGIGHFRTSVSKGIEIIENLRGHTSGLCIPTFIIDAPGGGGKIPVMPQYLVSRNEQRIVLRNYEGIMTTYTEPTDEQSEFPCENILRGEFPFLENKEGVAKLLSGKGISIEPEDLERFRRSAAYKSKRKCVGTIKYHNR
jgi:lysine 2,3-aminomutase